MQQKRLIAPGVRVAEHNRVDAEIRKAFAAGWDPDDFKDSVRKYSEFLFKEVRYDFLEARIHLEFKPKQKWRFFKNAIQKQ